MKTIRNASIWILVAMMMQGLILTSCSKDDDETPSAPTDITLKAKCIGTDYQYQLPRTSSNDMFLSSDKYVATVDSASGLITAKCIGETTIKAYTSKGIAEYKVKVEPTYSTFTEPFTLWGATSETIKKKITSGKWVENVGKQDTLMNSTYESKASLCAYVFQKNDKNETSLVEAHIVVPSFYKNEASLFINERYEYVTLYKLSNATVYIFLDKNMDTVIWLAYLNDASYIEIDYYSYEYFKNLITK